MLEIKIGKNGRIACIGVFLGVAAMCAATGQARAYEGGAVSNGGTIAGQVKYKGTPPPRQKLDINKDKEVCAVGGDHLSKDLVVGPDGGIQYAVVLIPNIEKGKPFGDTKPVLDQKGCEYDPNVLFAPAGGRSRSRTPTASCTTSTRTARTIRR